MYLRQWEPDFTYDSWLRLDINLVAVVLLHNWVLSYTWPNLVKIGVNNQCCIVSKVNVTITLVHRMFWSTSCMVVTSVYCCGINDCDSLVIRLQQHNLQQHTGWTECLLILAILIKLGKRYSKTCCKFLNWSNCSVCCRSRSEWTFKQRREP